MKKRNNKKKLHTLVNFASVPTDVFLVCVLNQNSASSHTEGSHSYSRLLQEYTCQLAKNKIKDKNFNKEKIGFFGINSSNESSFISFLLVCLKMESGLFWTNCTIFK